MFTKEQIEEIRSKLQFNSKKDTQMNNASLPVNGSEEISFVQNGKNVKMNMMDLINNLLLFRASDFINLSENFNLKFTLQEAIKYVSPVNRKIGVVITYIDSTLNDWVIFQYKGQDKSEWLNIEYWQSLLDNGRFKGYFANKELLYAIYPNPNIGDYAFVGLSLGSSVVYRCVDTYNWQMTSEEAKDYAEVIIKGNITVGKNGNWYQDGEDTGIKALGPKGDTPILRVNSITKNLEYSYDSVEWKLLAERESIKGEAATVEIVETVSVGPNEKAKVENLGSPFSAKLKFYIKQGIQGIQGIQGPKGEKGDAGNSFGGAVEIQTTLDTNATDIQAASARAVYLKNVEQDNSIFELNKIEDDLINVDIKNSIGTYKLNFERLYYFNYYISSEGTVIKNDFNHTFFIPIKKYTEVSIKTYQYGDTAVLGWVKNIPTIGDTVNTENLVFGNTNENIINYMMIPNDGYLLITLIKEKISLTECLLFLKDYSNPIILSHNIDFLNTQKINGNYILNKDKITASIECTSYIVKLNKGHTIIYSGSQWDDSAQIAVFNTFPSIGDTAFKVIVGSADGGISTKYYTAENDVYVALFNLNNNTNISSYIHSNLYESINRIEKEVYSLINDFNPIISNNLNIDSLHYEKYNYILSDNKIISVKTVSAYIVKLYNGSTINYKGCQWEDSAQLAIFNEYPKVGATALHVIAGISSTIPSNVSYTSTSDVYAVLFNLDSNSTIEIYTDDKFKPTINSLQRDVENLKLDIGLEKLDLTTIKVKDAFIESEWSGNQIIDNIYEPLRKSYPEYITRKSLGKDASGLYDIWMYEFNNNCQEWFSLDNFFTIKNCTILPNEVGANSNQVVISKITLDELLRDKQYTNLYINSTSYSVRNPQLVINKELITINGLEYYKLTCSQNIAIKSINDRSIELSYTYYLDTSEQHAFITSGVHGDEVAGYLGLALSLKYLCENWVNNQSLKYIHDNIKLYVIPIVNIWGSNQSPKVRNNFNGTGLNNFNNTPLSIEQQILSNFIIENKSKLSFSIDYHTSELWNDYGMNYVIFNKGSKLIPSSIKTAGKLCKRWFPNLPPYNWNVGILSNYNTLSKYISSIESNESCTIEFCGQDLINLKPCTRWDSQYMSYCVESYLEYLMEFSIKKVKIINTDNEIINNPLILHETMA